MQVAQRELLISGIKHYYLKVTRSQSQNPARFLLMIIELTVFEQDLIVFKSFWLCERLMGLEISLRYPNSNQGNPLVMKSVTYNCNLPEYGKAQRKGIMYNKSKLKSGFFKFTWKITFSEVNRIAKSLLCCVVSPTKFMQVYR